MRKGEPKIVGYRAEYAPSSLAGAIVKDPGWRVYALILSTHYNNTLVKRSKQVVYEADTYDLAEQWIADHRGTAMGGG